MKSSSVALLVAGMMAVIGCGGSDDPATPQGQAGQAGSGGSGGAATFVACGSADLFAQAHDGCEAMDAAGTTDEDGQSCYCFLGFSWNGTACVGLTDCRCSGADCDKLTETQEACESQHAACTAAPPLSLHCGSTQMYSKKHDVCGAMDAHDSPDENGMSCDCFLGFAWNGAECVGLGDCRCVGADCDKLTQTQEECQTAHAVCMSDPPMIQCGSSQLFSQTHNECSAMDAVAVPDENGSSCNCMLGYAWNGSACVGLGDCRCAGADCDKLTQDIGACEAAHAACN